MKTASICATILLLWTLLSTSAAATPHISEIMANPAGSDNSFEYVELANASGNLSGWTIGDERSNDTLLLASWMNTSIALIVEEDDTRVWNCTVYTASASIGNGLGNGGDTIRLYANGTLIDEVAYDEAEADLPWEQSGEQVPGGTPCSAAGAAEPSDTIDGPPDTSSEQGANRTDDSPSIDGTLRVVWEETVPAGEPVVIASVAWNGSRPAEVAISIKGEGVEDKRTLLVEREEEVVRTLTAGTYEACVGDECRTLHVERCGTTFGVELREALIEEGERFRFRPVMSEERGAKIAYRFESIDGETLREATTENTDWKQWTPEPEDPLEAYRLVLRLGASACQAERVEVERLVVVRRDVAPRLELAAPKRVEEGQPFHILLEYEGDAESIKVELRSLDGSRLGSPVTLEHTGRLALAFPFVARGSGEAILSAVAGELQAERPVTIEAPVEASILSFYTRARKPRGNVTFFARVNTSEEVEYEFVTNGGRVTGSVDGYETLEASLPVAPGRNVVALRLSANETLSERTLLIEGERPPRQEAGPDEPTLEEPAESYVRPTPLRHLKYVLGAIGTLVGGVAYHRAR